MMSERADSSCCPSRITSSANGIEIRRAPPWRSFSSSSTSGNRTAASEAAHAVLGGREAAGDEEDNETSLSPGQIVLLVYLLLVFLVGATANMSALLTFFRKSSLRTTSNRWVFNRAVALFLHKIEGLLALALFALYP